MSKRIYLFLSIGLAISLVVIYAFEPYITSGPVQSTDIASRNDLTELDKAEVDTPAVNQTAIKQDVDGDLDQQAALINLIKEKYGPTISNKHTQVKAIEKLLSYLKVNFPENWEAMLDEFLNLAFPDRAPELILLHKNMEEYNNWVASERHNLSKLSTEERNTLLWEMRLSFFGESAKDIWSESLKNQRIASSLAEIAMSGEQTSLDDKAQQYASTIREVYGEQSERVMENRRQELVDRFLRSGEVQAQLNKLDKEERYDNLSQIRKSLGMDEAALRRWGDLDRKRDERWERGKEYMKLRSELASQYEGTELDNRLRSIQNEFFGPEASTIRNEEDAGYFRFNETQIIGQN